MSDSGKASSFAPLFGLLGIFCLASGGLYLLATSLSHQIQDGYVLCVCVREACNWSVCMYVICRSPSTSLSFPKSVDELRELSSTLKLLKDEHFYGVLFLFSAAYLYKQTFAIPGSVFLVIEK